MGSRLQKQYKTFFPGDAVQSADRGFGHPGDRSAGEKGRRAARGRQRVLHADPAAADRARRGPRDPFGDQAPRRPGSGARPRRGVEADRFDAPHFDHGQSRRRQEHHHPPGEHHPRAHLARGAGGGWHHRRPGSGGGRARGALRSEGRPGARAGVAFACLPPENPAAEQVKTAPRWIGIAQAGLVAAAYFAAAKLALLAAIPPGYATAIWPASGIALAALMLGGRRLWPGVFVGSLAANLTIEGSLFASAVIATGSALQAVAGAELIRRYIGVPYRFRRAESVVRFVGLAA